MINRIRHLKIQYYVIIVMSVVGIGIAVTLFGLQQISWFDSGTYITWFAGSPSKVVLQFLIAALVVEALSRVLGLTRLASGAVVACVIAIYANAIWPLLVTLCFMTSSLLLGRMIIVALKVCDDGLSKLSLLLIGAGVYGTVAGMSAHFPINYPGLYWLVLLIPIIIERRYLVQNIRLFVNNVSIIEKYKWLDLAISLIAFVYFTVALMPEVGHDALAMHMFIPHHMSYWHQWGFDVTKYVWAVMPMMGDWIFSVVNLLGGETAARLTNVGFIFALAWLLRELVFWAGGSTLGARWAVLIFLTTPLVYTEASSLFVESIWTSFVVAGLLSILKILSSEKMQKDQLPVAGLLLGSALATKAVTLAILPVLLLALLFRYKYWIKIQLIPKIILGLLLFVVIGSIPYVTAWQYTGSPVFPFFNEIFQAPQYPPVNFSAAAFFEKGISWDTIYRVTFDSGRYLESRPGAAGFQWLLLFLPAFVLITIAWNRRMLTLVSVGMMMVVFTFHNTAYLRYVLPSFLILGAAVGAFLSVIMAHRNIWLNSTVLVAAILTILLNLLFFKSGTYAGDISRKALISKEGREQYLENRLPIRNAVNLVNYLNTSDAPVAVFASPLTAGLNSDALYPNWYNHAFNSRVNSAGSADNLAEVLITEGVDYVILGEGWGDADKRLMIKETTQLVSTIGSVSVRKLQYEYNFKTELLKNTRFSNGNHWQLANEANLKPNGILVNVDSPAFQVIPISPNRRYLLTVQATCAIEPAKGRLQVNWMDEGSNLIKTDIKVFECTEIPSSNSIEVNTPRGAVNAVIYAVGHEKVFLMINNVSFKQ